MTPLKEREILKSLYNRSKGWIDRVNRMSDAQVIAVFMRLKHDGKI